MTSFPTTIDVFVNPTDTDGMDNPAVYHDVQHENINDSVAALEARVGITASAVVTSHEYRLAQLEAAPPSDTVQGGSVALGNGVESGSVTGLALPSTPAAVLLTVQSPSGGFVMFAMVVGAPTTGGFAWQLSGVTDATTYRLHYLIVL